MFCKNHSCFRAACTFTQVSNALRVSLIYRFLKVVDMSTLSQEECSKIQDECGTRIVEEKPRAKDVFIGSKVYKSFLVSVPHVYSMSVFILRVRIVVVRCH